MRYVYWLCVIIFIVIQAPASYSQIEEAFSPNQGATKLITDTIGKAHSTILVAAYSFTSMPIEDALLEAKNRGVDVQVVLDKSNLTAKFSGYQFLKRNGIPVRIDSHYAIMHDKFMILDGEYLELGSFNFTTAAEKHNAENVMVIHGNDMVIQSYIDQWRKLWNESE